ncbi:hypothetical protein EBB79_17025 [Parasedimentitalea marina]|uniref:Lipoprotein n=1 Tax=Parasedimentitalea marina TaxID=2483033 RepID=A0A3T0N5W0_9RHOB|nr:hypothetical protein [Parasedimentitalea marina]AZV79408.1 hypothetical protein EBB79_17025 [Parasedimentitalea marina]
MKLISKFLAGAALLALSSCGTSQQAFGTKPLTLEETEKAVNLFSDFCLGTLPNDFRGARHQAARHNLGLTHSEGKRLFYAKGDKFMVAAIANEGGRDICVVGFAGSTDINSVSQMFLQQAQAKTGGKPREKFPSSHFEFAYHLNNGSFFTHDVKLRKGVTRHIFSVSLPEPRSEIANYIYK